MKKKNKLIEKGLFFVLVLLYSMLMFVLFYKQCIFYNGQYVSDMGPYILEAQGKNTAYSYPYPIMFWIARIMMIVTTPEVAMAGTVTILNTLGVCCVKYYTDQYLNESLKKIGKEKMGMGWNILSSLLAVSLFFIFYFYVPKGHGFFDFEYVYRCSGIYTPNPYWNATYLAARPFSIIAFVSGIKMLEHYEKDEKLSKDWLIFSISLLTTTMTKPSYTLVAVVAFAIILLYRFVRSKCRNLKQSILFGLSFIPTGCALLYQYSGVFTGTNSKGEDAGIGFAIGKAWSVYAPNIPISVLLAIAFPLGVLLMNLPRLKDTTWFRHGWQIWCSGFVMLLCLYEKGFRMIHTNFAWGYMHGLFLLFMVSVWMLLNNTIAPKNKTRKVLVTLGWIGYVWHLIWGVAYYIYIFNGNT